MFVLYADKIETTSNNVIDMRSTEVPLESKGNDLVFVPLELRFI